MLGKLLKHEWKAVWKTPMLLIGILMITAAIAGLTFSLPIWDSEWVGLPLSGMMLICMFYIAMIAVYVGITIYFAVRYYKNMFTDEGYLTHTLPVTSRQLLLNKTITMSVWNLIGMIAIFASIFVFGGIMMLSLMPKSSSFAQEFIEGMAAWPEALKTPYMKGFYGFCLSSLFTLVVSSFSNAMMIIGSITLGQMVRKHRILGAIGAYFGFSIAIQIVSTMVIMPTMFTLMDVTFDNMYMDMSPFPVMTVFMLIISCVYLAVALGLYFMSEYLLRRKLELE